MSYSKVIIMLVCVICINLIFLILIYTHAFSLHTHTHKCIIKFCPYPVRAMRKFMNSVLVGISVLQTINAF